MTLVFYQLSIWLVNKNLFVVKTVNDDLLIVMLVIRLLGDKEKCYEPNL